MTRLWQLRTPVHVAAHLGADLRRPTVVDRIELIVRTDAPIPTGR